jgi:hypothetical protein
MFKIVILLSILVFSSCSKKGEDLKSPCVGEKNSPCGPRVPVNKWMS